MRNLWRKYKAIARKIGDFQATVWFSLLYFILVTPIGVVANFFNDNLSLRSFPEWKKIEDNANSLERLKKQ